MKKSINQWAFPAGMQLRECLQQAKDAGFEGFEPALADDGALALSTSEADARQVAQAAAEVGIEIASVATGLLWRHPLTSNDAAEVRQGKAIVRKAIELATWLGTDAILVVPGTVTAEVPYDVALARAQEALAELATEAEAAKVILGVENVWNKLLLSPLEMRDFIDALASPWVRVYFDVGNVLVSGFPQHWIRILGERICRIHVKDFETSIGNITGFTTLLAGDVDWPEVVKALREIGYDSYITAELSPYRNHPQQLIRHTAASLAAILAG
ncbi:xylulose 5-phosphate 3-epimerase [candidate division KD3-62 bacterium DG_56]|uniref:Xylulose 5-phosphate 3-epimerase n=1 Tax=candidate division KD3-62 bacterium DG_56 TaxID=1704032 RepID=A0A0S7XQ70_9BACT|nr:MAG: xylulose 5-phosphate 3-epimerase [candidate division KD3-62 bacterium DG_56]